MEDAVLWYERFGAPVVYFLLDFGQFAQENPLTIMVILVVLVLFFVVLRIVFKLAPFIIVLVLILLLFVGGFGATVWNFFFGGEREDQGYTIDVANFINAKQAPRAEALLTQYLGHNVTTRAHPWGSIETTTSISDECPQSVLPETFHTYREGILRLHQASIQCPHEVMYMFLSGLGTDRKETEWIDVAGEVTDTSVSLEAQVMMNLPNYFVLESVLKKLYDAEREYSAKRTFWSSFKEMVKIENAPQGILVHTHPAHLLGMIAMPPSLIDIMMSSSMQHFVEFEVVDPTGKWAWRSPDRLNVLAMRYTDDFADVDLDESDIKLFDQLMDIDKEISIAKKDGRYTEALGIGLMTKRELVLRELGVELSYQPLGRWFDI